MPVALVLVAAAADLRSAERFGNTSDPGHRGNAWSVGGLPPGPVDGGTIERLLRSGREDVGEIVEAFLRRHPGRGAPAIRAELYLRLGSVAEANRMVAAGDLDGDPALVATIELLAGVRGTNRWSMVGRIAEAVLQLDDEDPGGVLDAGVRRNRLARLVALVDPVRARGLAHEVWRSGYLTGDLVLAADGLVTLSATGIGAAGGTSALAARAERLYLRGGVDARATIARGLRVHAGATRPPVAAPRMCEASAGAMRLVRAECLLAAMGMARSTGGHARAALIADALRARLVEMPYSFTERFAVRASPLYELVGRPADAEHLLAPFAFPGSHAGVRSSVLLAGLLRRVGRPSSSRALLERTGEIDDPGIETRRLIELALSARELGGAGGSVSRWLDQASVRAGERERLRTSVALATSAVDAPSTSDRAEDDRLLAATRGLRRRAENALRATGRATDDAPGSRLALADAVTPVIRAHGRIEPELMAPAAPAPSGRLGGPEEHIRRHLGPRTRLIVFEARPDALVVTLADRAGQRRVEAGIVPRNLQTLVDLWVASIEAEATEAWWRLGTSIARALRPVIPTPGDGVERVIVVGDLGVHGLPFAALPSGDPGAGPPEHVLGERIAFSRAPSVAALEAAWHRAPASGSSLVVLPGTIPGGDETHHVLGARRGTVLRGRRATESALARLAPGAGLIHFGGHARPVAGTWRDGGLELRADRFTDGVLTFEEITRLEVAGARVILLGCETGRGRMFGPGQIRAARTSLSEAFLLAGARSIIGTLWRITEEEAVLLAQELYAMGVAWGGADSLARATRRLRQRFPDRPRLWAAALWDGAPDAVTPTAGRGGHSRAAGGAPVGGRW